MGKDSYEEAQVNAVCDAFTDILENMVKAHFAKCDEDKVCICSLACISTRWGATQWPQFCRRQFQMV